MAQLLYKTPVFLTTKVIQKGISERYPTTSENLRPNAFAMSMNVESCMSV